MGILEEVVENSLQGAAEGVRGAAARVVEDFGRRQASRVIDQVGHIPTGRFACSTCMAEGAVTPTNLQCTGCARAFCARHSDYVHSDPSARQCLCPTCTAFMWDAATTAVSRMRQAGGAPFGGSTGAGPQTGPQQQARGAAPKSKPVASDKDWQELGLARGAALEAINEARKRLQRQWHPDRFPEGKRAEAEERFKRVGEAADRCAATWRS